MVGRQQELAQLQQFLRPLHSAHFAGLLVCLWRAGIGKTRLLYELQQQTAAQAQWLFCPCDELLRQSLNPFKECLANFFNQSSAAAPTANQHAFAAKFDHFLTQLAAAPDPRQEAIRDELRRSQSILAGMLNLPEPGALWIQLDSRLRFENMLRTFKAFVKGLSLLQPVILFMDDLQWLDEDSRRLLQTLTHNVDSFALAVVGTSRYLDGDRQVKPELVIGQPIATLDLHDLNREGIHGLAEKVVGGAVTDQVVDFLTEKTEGNPFFVEQLCLGLKERGQLTVGETAVSPILYDLTGDILADIPTSISGVLIARLDRLPLPVKEVVQTAAVLGFQFDAHILQQMLLAETRLPRWLKAAAQAAIWTAISEIEYIFKHALMRQAAYEMQLHARLRESHHLAAQAYQHIYQDDLAPYYGHLAYHYEQAGAETETLLYLEKAADYAADQYANETAVTLYDKLLTAPISPVQALHIQRRKAEVLYNMGRYQAAIDLLESGIAENNAIGDRHMACVLHTYLGQVLWRRRDKVRSLAVSLQAKQLAEELGDQRQLGIILGNIGVAEHMHGRVAAALACHEQACAALQAVGDQRELARLLNSTAVIRWQDGDLAGSLAANLEARRLQEAINHRQGLANSLNNIGVVYKDQGDLPAALAYYEQALALATELGAPLIMSHAQNNIASTYALQGNYAAAHHYHQLALAMTDELDVPYWRVHFSESRMETFWREGRTAEAAAASEKLLALAEQIKQDKFIFFARFMAARCLAETDPATAVTQLTQLLADATEENHEARERKAQLLDALWQIQKEHQPTAAVAYRQEAMRLYQQLYERMPASRYQERLAVYQSS
ncbi:MAG: AAA family ATPase [Chloroflexota bacterium]